MADDLHTETAPGLSALANGIITDAQRLIRQELALARSEIQQEWDKTKSAAGELGVGIVILALGGIFLCFMLVYLLNWLTEMPLWVGYGIVGVLLAVAGAILLYLGRKQATDIHFVPQQTVETMRENVQWLKNQT